jgi:NitT/TauT family transport system substrate-binding protein/putative hydroxymethylpyrimidine transport system substrate-binding protein
MLQNPMRRVLPLLAVLAALLSACGGGDSGSPASAPRAATLVLDFTPNAAHAGIYAALAHGLDRQQGVHLHVQVPGASTDSVKLLLGGRADFAILDIHDLALARQQGRDLVGVTAIVQRPLAAVLAQPSVASPRLLAGRKVGVSGLPSDDAVLRSIVTGAGGDWTRVHRVTIGFDAVPALLGGRVAGATAFWNVEGVALRAKRPGTREFRVDAYGAPHYPELVLVVTRATLARNRTLVEAVVRALAGGYSMTVQHPRQAVADLRRAVPGLDRAQLQQQLAVLLPALQGPGGRIGALDPATLRAWAKWEARFGIVKRPPDVSKAFDTTLVPG